MNRSLYLIGFGYIALCVSLVVRAVTGRPETVPGPYVQVSPPPPPPPEAAAPTGAAKWFAEMKPYCNPVEVEVRTRFSPLPNTRDGAGYSAACFALAGKIDRAREIIEKLAPGDRGVAANVLFEIAHPVADAGDDRASGPMMELVLEYWPNNYMALYHAGMSEYSLGQSAVAAKHLRAFLGMYNQQDGFTGSARAALAKIAEGGAAAGKVVEQETPAKP
jgi:hypothetical protein